VIFRRAVWLYAPPLFWAGLIFFMSHRPAPAAMPAMAGSDKIIHLLVYLLLALLVVRALGEQRQVDALGLVAVGVLIVGLYGVGDEVHQSFVPSRSPDVLDAYADLAGATIGSVAAVWGRTRKK